MIFWDLLYYFLWGWVDGFEIEYMKDFKLDERLKVSYCNGCVVVNIEKILIGEIEVFWIELNIVVKIIWVDLVIVVDGVLFIICKLLFF